jgi:hypothetical protein
MTSADAGRNRQGATNNGEQDHHQLRDHRFDPHPDHVGRAADHARSDRYPGDRCRQGRRRHPASARPRPQGRPAGVGCQRVHAISAAHQAGDRRRGEHHHRWRSDHDGRSAHLGGQRAIAGNVLDEYGLDEFRALSDDEALQKLEIRLGGKLPRQFRRLHLSQYVPRYREGVRHAGQGPRREVRARVLRHRVTCTISPIWSTAACSSRRSSCSSSSASSAASAPTSTICSS